MEKKVKVAIIGSGTAGLSAWREVMKETDDYVVFNSGPYGTTCARVGCMPSKALIQCANDFHRRGALDSVGIHGGNGLSVSLPEVLAHVRKLRDRFVSGVLGGGYVAIGERNIPEHASFLEPTLLKAGDQVYRADRVIIATGSTPKFPAPWNELLGDRLYTSDTIFEQEDLPKRLAVIGLGVIGLELGQALARLGVEVVGVNSSDKIGGLSDPEVLAYSRKILADEMPLVFEAADLKRDGDTILVNAGGKTWQVDGVLAAMGRRPRLDGLGLENLGVPLGDEGLPAFDPLTMQIEDLPVFIAGDAMGLRPILHEAADEGRIAGYNAVREEVQCFQRRTGLGITFSDPNIAVVGQSHQELVDDGVSMVTGTVQFEGQGRALVKGKNKGLLKVYGDRTNGRLLGAEMIAPEGEHLAHLLSWAIQQKMTAVEALRMPYYHPVIEEGLRTALRDLAANCGSQCSAMEIAVCESGPEVGLD